MNTPSSLRWYHRWLIQMPVVGTILVAFGDDMWAAAVTVGLKAGYNLEGVSPKKLSQRQITRAIVRAKREIERDTNDDM